MTSSLIEVVQHYKKKIERNNDQKKILHCFNKLMGLPVTLDVLSETGVGKTVNAFRRDEGIVGSKSRELVSKWKRIFEETEQERMTSSGDCANVRNGTVTGDECGALQTNGASDHSAAVHAEALETSDARLSRHSARPQIDADSSSVPAAKYRSGGGGGDQPSVESHRSADSKHRQHADRREQRHAKSHRRHSESRSKSGQHDRTAAVAAGPVEPSEGESSPPRATARVPQQQTRPEASGDDKRRHRRHADRERGHRSAGERDTSGGGGRRSPGVADSGRGSRLARELSEEPAVAVAGGASFSDILGGVDADLMKKKKKAKKSPEKSKHSRVPSAAPAAGAAAVRDQHGRVGSAGATTCQSSRNSSSSGAGGTDSGGGGGGGAIGALNTSAAAAATASSDSHLCHSTPLPSISAVYRPLPRSAVQSDAKPQQQQQQAAAKRAMDEEEALSAVLAAKNKRTKVYSGTKSFGWTRVPTLVDICLRSLQENINYLEYTGGVPYDILRPVLERCTAEQLHSIEYYNAYLTEDTAALWQNLVGKQFRNCQRLEMETWKEMYMRCCEEREDKLEKLRATIESKRKTSLASSSKTKVVYVNSVAKPPRNVARKQVKNGTSAPTGAQLPLKLARGATGAPLSDPAASTMPSRSGASANQKRKAPLMAKVLRSIGGRR